VINTLLINVDSTVRQGYKINITKIGNSNVTTKLLTCRKALFYPEGIKSGIDWAVDFD
jgi:hypothetical protein